MARVVLVRDGAALRASSARGELRCPGWRPGGQKRARGAASGSLPRLRPHSPFAFALGIGVPIPLGDLARFLDIP